MGVPGCGWLSDAPPLLHLVQDGGDASLESVRRPDRLLLCPALLQRHECALSGELARGGLVTLSFAGWPRDTRAGEKIC